MCRVTLFLNNYLEENVFKGIDNFLDAIGQIKIIEEDYPWDSEDNIAIITITGKIKFVQHKDIKYINIE